MITTWAKILHHPLQALVGLFIVFIACVYTACSNSESVGSNSESDSIADWDSPETSNASPSRIIDYLPLDDSEYPYVGIPRIVIETENHQAIKDRKTEISAKLQIWGKNAPESEIMDLTIRGRGNTTWGYPKKPYIIKLKKKESILGMPAAKKWILLANYRDRTLMRNAIAFELARKTSLVWTPSGKFTEIFLNERYLGNYFLCEKIEVKQNRLDLNGDAFLIELDSHFDEDKRFKTKYDSLPVNIKYPKDDNSSINKIQSYMDSIEIVLQQGIESEEYLDYIDQESFADYLLVYALANNAEPYVPKSVFLHKNGNGKLSAGPVWDFDWATFDIRKGGFSIFGVPLFKRITGRKPFVRALTKRWQENKNGFEEIFDFVDSLANYISVSNNRVVSRVFRKNSLFQHQI